MAALAAQANPRSLPEVSLFVLPKSFCLARLIERSALSDDFRHTINNAGKFLVRGSCDSLADAVDG